MSNTEVRGQAAEAVPSAGREPGPAGDTSGASRWWASPSGHAAARPRWRRWAAGGVVVVVAAAGAGAAAANGAFGEPSQPGAGGTGSGAGRQPGSRHTVATENPAKGHLAHRRP